MTFDELMLEMYIEEKYRGPFQQVWDVAWLASRQQALEEAIEVARHKWLQEWLDHGQFTNAREAFEIVCDAICSLKEKQS